MTDQQIEALNARLSTIESALNNLVEQNKPKIVAKNGPSFFAKLDFVQWLALLTPLVFLIGLMEVIFGFVFSVGLGNRLIPGFIMTGGSLSYLIFVTAFYRKKKQGYSELGQ
ncbi:hypothetical protein CJU89_4079 [Yarrowia sp. B02]|nr:hypothetical protein CJU89_4079 [Yarrowia sp. B02]